MTISELFVEKYFTVERILTRIFILDIYGPVLGQSPKVDDMLAKLQLKIASELKYQKQAFELMGSLDTIFAVAATSRNTHSLEDGLSWRADGSDLASYV